MENNDRELIKELSALELERSESKTIVRGRQNEMAEMLLGSMGKDMDDILTGKKQIKIKKRSLIGKMGDAFDKFLRRINGEDNNGVYA